MTSAKIHRGILVTLALSILLVLPARAHAGTFATPRPAPQTTSWGGFVNLLRWAGLGDWLDLAGWRGASSRPKDGATPVAGSTSGFNPPGVGPEQHGTIDPNGLQ
jgi:hypothetical protein